MAVVLIEIVLVSNVVASLCFMHRNCLGLAIMRGVRDLKMVETPFSNLDGDDLLGFVLAVVEIADHDQLMAVKVKVFAVKVKLISRRDV